MALLWPQTTHILDMLSLSVIKNEWGKYWRCSGTRCFRLWLFILRLTCHLCVCVCACWSMGCLVLNKNWFCLMPVLTCVTECAWNVGCICHWGSSFHEDVPLVEFVFLLFTCMPDNYCRQLRSSLLCLCQCVMSFQRYLINSFVCCFLLSLTREHICCWDEFKSSSLTQKPCQAMWYLLPF